MEIQPDFRELLELFNAKSVEYLVVGGYALAFHGAPRYTGDIDLFVNPTPENAGRIMSALEAFGFGDAGLSVEVLLKLNQVVQLGMPPVRIEIITSISGVTWEEAAGGKVPGPYGDVPVYYIGRAQFVANKKAVGRLKDLADLEALGEG